jgi:glycosyltransferase involved in cell wall biosynthesis
MSLNQKLFARILFLGNPLTDRRVKNFITFFLKEGYDLEFVYATPGKDIPNFGSEQEVHSVRLPLKYSGGAKMFLSYQRTLKKYLASAKPCDVLFASELFSLKAASEARHSGKAKQLIYDAREIYTELPTVANNRLKKLFWKQWEKIGLEQSDLVIVTAPDDAGAIKLVHGFLPPHIIIRNLPRYENFHPNNYLREYFNVQSEKKIFVYVGGLQQDRGLECMIDVMPSLVETAVFIIIGDGSKKEILKQKVVALRLNQSVFFHPAIDSGKVIEVLSSADAGINLIEQHSISYRHALPSKLFEYMLAGLPVISSPLKQVKDLFADHEGIFFADPDNEPQILDASKKALGKSNDLNFRNKLHDEAAKNFTFDHEAQSLFTFLS